jgi:hypothetical protein
MISSIVRLHPTHTSPCRRHRPVQGLLPSAFAASFVDMSAGFADEFGSNFDQRTTAHLAHF